MGKVLDPETLRWDQLLQHPWQWVLFGLFLTAATSGLVYITYSMVGCANQRQAARNTAMPTLSTQTSSHLKLLTEKLSPRLKPESLKVSSFGIYLGDFSSSLTDPQINILEQNELVILDPFRSGVEAAVRNIEGRHLWIGRLDLAMFLAKGVSPDLAVSDIANMVLRSFPERLMPVYFWPIGRTSYHANT